MEPAFASLNIAQAVLVLAYEWRRETGKGTLPFNEPDSTPASKDDQAVVIPPW